MDKIYLIETVTALNDIHRDAINSSVASYYINVVLEGRTPAMAGIEKNLPWKTKVVEMKRYFLCTHFSQSYGFVDPTILSSLIYPADSPEQ